MKEIKEICSALRREILEFLYEDEVMNVLLIHCFENDKKEHGQVYLSYAQDKLESVLHMNNDGNSYFTSFYSNSEKGLKSIALFLAALSYKKILLAGRESDIRYMMTQLHKKTNIHLDSYLIYKKSNRVYNSKTQLRKAGLSDFEFVRHSLFSFFGTTNEESKERITKTLDLERYRILEVDGQSVGMGSFFASSEKYIDITAVYINESHRGKGYGSDLILQMVEAAINQNKIPILQVSNDNKIANSLNLHNFA